MLCFKKLPDHFKSSDKAKHVSLCLHPRDYIFALTQGNKGQGISTRLCVNCSNLRYFLYHISKNHALKRVKWYLIAVLEVLE